MPDFKFVETPYFLFKKIAIQQLEFMLKLDYKRIRYVCGFTDIEKIPSDTGCEVAFIGYSNSGKSSVLNTISGNNKLSKTSKKPGCTKKINFFYVNRGRRMVDLPGYGHAKISQKMKRSWENNINLYLKRKSLRGVVLIADVRHIFKPIDKKLMNWVSTYCVPLHIVLTKSDKLQNQEGEKVASNAKDALAEYKHAHTIQLFSSKNKTGDSELTDIISSWLL